MVRMPTAEEIAALRQALADAIARGEQAARRSEELAALGAHTADASGRRPRLLARHGQNDRAMAVGRRNWLFADTVAGANASASASANLYSLLQTCMANGIDSYRYLRAVLTELPKARTVEDYDALLPWRLAPVDR